MTIGDRIRALRKEKGLTQKELAQKLGVSASMIGQYETSVRKPKFETVEKIADALGVNTMEIVDMSPVSPYLNEALSIIYNIDKSLGPRKQGKTIKLSDDEKGQFKKAAELFNNVHNELQNSSFFINLMRDAYIAIFDELNYDGKCLAFEAVTELYSNPDLKGP